MLRLLLFAIVFFLGTSSLFAQNEADSVEIQVVDSLIKDRNGFSVLWAENDTLIQYFDEYSGMGADERAYIVNRRIQKLKLNKSLHADSLQVTVLPDYAVLRYGTSLLLQITPSDARYYNLSKEALIKHLERQVSYRLNVERNFEELKTIAGRIGLVILVLFIGWHIFKWIGKAHLKLLVWVRNQSESWFRDIRYRDYTFLSAQQQKLALLNSARFIRWILYVLLLYISLPILFSIFPFSRTWAETLFDWMWSPFSSAMRSVWDYIPNLFSIIVIVGVMRFSMRIIRYFFSEIRDEKLEISGFHSDWAMPTYNIVRFLLYAFTIVLVFPYLPGSDSEIFKGVSVFLGLLISLGSSSAISNMVAGLVITYMRPFKIGDRITIGEVSGDVLEKTMLVTRLKTVKNEVVTIPNSAVLSGNTTNFSSVAQEKGLIIHTTITIGYDIPWQKMHKALQTAARRTVGIEEHPSPFVLQTELQDFYVAYQINGFTKQAARQAAIKSDLHRHILDICKEMDIEILSPHYRAERSGEPSTIPPDYVEEKKDKPTDEAQAALKEKLKESRKAKEGES